MRLEARTSQLEQCEQLAVCSRCCQYDLAILFRETMIYLFHHSVISGEAEHQEIMAVLCVNLNRIEDHETRHRDAHLQQDSISLLSFRFTHP